MRGRGAWGPRTRRHRRFRGREPHTGARANRPDEQATMPKGGCYGGDHRSWQMGRSRDMVRLDQPSPVHVAGQRELAVTKQLGLWVGATNGIP